MFIEESVEISTWKRLLVNFSTDSSSLKKNKNIFNKRTQICNKKRRIHILINSIFCSKNKLERDLCSCFIYWSLFYFLQSQLLIWDFLLIHFEMVFYFEFQVNAIKNASLNWIINSFSFVFKGIARFVLLSRIPPYIPPRSLFFRVRKNKWNILIG